MALETIGVDGSRAAAALKTGTEWYSYEIIRALARIAERPALRVYHRDASTMGEFPNVEDVLIDRQKLWTHVGLDGELRRAPVDALFVPAHVLPRSHPAATTVTLHDLGYRHEAQAHTLRRRAVLAATTRWSARRAARIIVPSGATGADLTDAYGIDSEKIDVIPHGVDHLRFREQGAAEVQRTLAALGVTQPYILFVSTIQPRKNLSRLIAAFETSALSEYRLVIAGAPGWKSQPIIARIRMSARREDINVLGYVDEEHVPTLYTGAAAFVLPSLYEGFGMGAIEAMACGCPVVVSSTASLPEIVEDAAIVVDPHSVDDVRKGLLQALDAGCGQRLRARGLAHASKFTWERAAQATLNSLRAAYEQTAG